MRGNKLLSNSYFSVYLISPKKTSVQTLTHICVLNNKGPYFRILTAVRSESSVTLSFPKTLPRVKSPDYRDGDSVITRWGCYVHDDEELAGYAWSEQ
jgi:hypothetical protein